MVANRDEIMIMDELAEYLKISKSTLRKLGWANRLLGQNDKRWRFREEAADEWVKYSLRSKR